MKPFQNQDASHLMKAQAELLRRAKTPSLQLALACVLVLVGAYLYLVPNSITVSDTTVNL